MQISISQAKTSVMRILKAGLVPNLLSSPGLGKSALIREIAKENNLKLIDCRLSQLDATGLLGFPTINPERTRSNYAPPEYFPLEGDIIPSGYSGYLLFFDEMNSAPQSVQIAAYQIILDRAIGTHNIHKNVAMVCAGNLMTDRAIVNKMSTAMQSRLVHLEIKVDVDDWVWWATKNKIDHRVIGFIKFRPELLHKFSPDHKDNTFPCPRTWHFVSKLIINEPNITEDFLSVLQGSIGKGVALELFTFLNIYTKLPSIQEIISNPTTTSVPQEPSHKYAVSSLISSHMNIDNAIQCMEYVERLPIEFQVITLQSILKLNPELRNVISVKVWLRNNSCSLIL